MKLRKMAAWVKSGHLPLMIRLLLYMKPFYRLCFAAAAKNNGLMDILKEKQVPFSTLAREYTKGAAFHEALHAWLNVGVGLKELKLDQKGYALAGYSRKLARVENDAILALVQEVVCLHYRLIMKSPEKLREGDMWTLSDQDGEMIARSSRALEPLQTEVIELFYPKHGKTRLLEVGCGSGVYMAHAARKNPELTAAGIELQPDVAEMARKNSASWGFSDRIAVDCGDIRHQEPEATYDLVTLFNNIYYFPVAERTDLLGHVLTFLKPGGSLVITTCCADGGAPGDIINLWGAATKGCVRLPSRDEMKEHMMKAGFVGVEAKTPLPGGVFWMFRGLRPE